MSWLDPEQTGSRVAKRTLDIFLIWKKEIRDKNSLPKFAMINGQLVSSTKDILNTVKDYYKSIYTSCDPPQAEFEHLLPSDTQEIKLSLNSKEKCEGLITLNECLDQS